MEFAEETSVRGQERLKKMMEEYRDIDRRLRDQVTENVGLVASNRQYKIEIEDLQIDREKWSARHD